MFISKFGRVGLLDKHEPDKGPNVGGNGKTNPIDPTDPADPKDPGDGDELPKTMEELRALINSEADRRVNKQKETWEITTKKAIEEAALKAEERAKMSEKERLEAERKEQEAKQTAENEKLKQQLATFKAKSLLAAQGLPQDDVFTAAFIRSDETETETAIAAFKTAFDEAVKKEVTNRMTGGKTPASGGVSSTITKKASDYSFDEIQELFTNDKAKYNAIMAQL